MSPQLRMGMPMVSTAFPTTSHPKPPLGNLPEEEGEEGASLGGAEELVEEGGGWRPVVFPFKSVIM